MNNNVYFLGSSPWHGGHPDLREIKIIAAIRVIHEREPSTGFQKGNQYHELLNLIYGAKIDHSRGLNKAIANIALGIVKLRSSKEKEVLSLMPEVRNYFDRRISKWFIKKGGDNE